MRCGVRREPSRRSRRQPYIRDDSENPGSSARGTRACSRARRALFPYFFRIPSRYDGALRWPFVFVFRVSLLLTGLCCAPCCKSGDRVDLIGEHQ